MASGEVRPDTPPVGHGAALMSAYHVADVTISKALAKLRPSPRPGIRMTPLSAASEAVLYSVGAQPNQAVQSDENPHLWKQ